MCFFRVAEGGPLVPQYFRYWLESREFKRQAFDCMGKTDMAAYINLADLRSLELTLPSINTQQSVITVLGAVDDKIAVNKRLSALLWKHLDALFDRAVLHRCVSRRLGELATFHNAKRVPLSGKDRERRRGQVPYYGATGIFGHVDTALFEEPLVLIGEDGSVVTAEGRPVVQYIWGPSWVNNHAHVLTGTSVSTEVLATAVRRQSVRHLITGAVQPKLSMGKLKALELQLPEGHALKSLESQCWREVALIRAIIEETRTLKMLREALLPGLMAGRLRVKDAEKQAEEVL